jgi:hypothetical protein
VEIHIAPSALSASDQKAIRIAERKAAMAMERLWRFMRAYRRWFTDAAEGESEVIDG